jgi:hypothetical protein
MNHDNKIVDEYIKYKNFISDTINELPNHSRIEILQMIINDIDDEKIVEKGNGTQIKFADISHDVLMKIYNNILKKTESTTNNLY